MAFLLYILCAIIILKILIRGIRKSKIFFLKKEIEKSPLIGIKDLDGTYLYKKRGYTLRYRIIGLPSGIKKIKLISYKSRLTAFEGFIYKIKEYFQRLMSYSHLKPSLILPIFLIIIIVCVWMLIPQPKKARVYELVISRAVRVSSEQVEYKGGGWFEIYGKRIASKDKRAEPLTFTVNPFRWLFFGDAGFVTRWRGKDSGGYKTYYLEKDKEGKITARETGREIFTGKVKFPYVEGKVEGDKIKWAVPEGTTPGVTQDIKTTEEGIRIIDR